MSEAVSKKGAGMTAEVVAPAIEEILQVMYFCDGMYRGGAHVADPAFETQLRFTGAASGTFRVAISRAFAAGMAADFLALDPDAIATEQIDSTVKEFANVACGATMSAWMPSADFHFSVPAELQRVDTRAEFPHCFSVLSDSPEIGLDVSFEQDIPVE
jgi:hypothetical protein